MALFALGIIAIHVDDLLISGGNEFTDYISRVSEGGFEVERYGRGEATYLGMGVAEAIDSDFEGLVLGPGNYEDKPNQIEIHLFIRARRFFSSVPPPSLPQHLAFRWFRNAFHL